MSDSPTLPTPLPPPPRNVPARGRFARVLLRFISLFVSLVALACVAYFVLTVIWFFAGKEITGEVYSTHSESGSRTSTYYLDYSYYPADSPDHSVDDKQSVTYATMEAMRVAARTHHVPVKVRYSTFGSVRIACLPEYTALWWELTKVAGFTLIVAGMSFAVFWTAWIRPVPELKLLRFGRATPGAVTGKRTAEGRFTYFIIQYAYDAAPDKKYKAEVTTSQALWQAAQIGDVVTVLFDPKNDKKSLVYEFTVLKVAS